MTYSIIRSDFKKTRSYNVLRKALLAFTEWARHERSVAVGKTNRNLEDKTVSENRQARSRTVDPHLLGGGQGEGAVVFLSFLFTFRFLSPVTRV